MTLSKPSIGLLVALLSATPLAAQRASSPFDARPASVALALPPMTGGAQTQGDDDVGLMVLGGVVLGALGFYAGGSAAAHLTDGALGPTLLGAIAGQATAIPLGVHVAGPGRRSITPSLAASWAIAGQGSSRSQWPTRTRSGVPYFWARPWRSSSRP